MQSVWHRNGGGFPLYLMAEVRYQNSLAFAQSMDRKDPLKRFRSKFHFPGKKNSIYLVGNSLGLQPKRAEKYVLEELKAWAQKGVEGHFRGTRPWVDYQKFFKKRLAELVGAKSIEVVPMGQLTTNLHLLFVSFYRPSPSRYKIITEQGAFSSDQYLLESQVKFHGYDPFEAIIEIEPRSGAYTLDTQDIIQCIEKHGDQVALVFMGGVQYYTGQFFDIKKITRAGHDVGAYVGFDLAHAIGNVNLRLHNDGVDFAAWCTYKYLNSGPGAVSGIFVHQRFAEDTSLPRLAGWWGHDEQTRFMMKGGFDPMKGADGWQQSNFSVLSGASHLASLEMFSEAGMKNIRQKSELLTGYAAFLLDEIDPHENYFSVITPSNPKERGSQLSIYMKQRGKNVFESITKKGIIADWREPSVIRIAPVPLYNTFEEVFKFAKIFSNSVKTK